MCIFSSSQGIWVYSNSVYALIILYTIFNTQYKTLFPFFVFIYFLLQSLSASYPELHCALHFPNCLSHLSRHRLLSSRGRLKQFSRQLFLWALHPLLHAFADTVVITRPTTSRTINSLVWQEKKPEKIICLKNVNGGCGFYCLFKLFLNKNI